MEKRKLGNTGLEVTNLGFGGFHLLEIPASEAVQLVNAYLDKGGNYIETAATYGNGESERKIGMVMEKRRKECVLVSKTPGRDAEECRKTVEQSLGNLRTDHLDILLMHAVDSMEELDKILAPEGAFNEARKLKEEGKIKHIGLSMHGQPDVLIEALKRAPFEVVMSTINYYDINNYPKLLNELVPLAHEKGVGIILMKPLADGLLWRSVEKAFEYALSLDVSVVVTGMNSMEMLETDMHIADTYKKLTPEQMQEIIDTAPELGDYVCRQCGKCEGICPEEINFMQLFRLEGLFDRQMRTGKVNDTGDFALRDRLRFWFGTNEKAKEQYRLVEPKGNVCNNCGACKDVCPYKIDIQRKVNLGDYKLGQREIY